jgi:hypothetical protein
VLHDTDTKRGLHHGPYELLLCAQPPRHDRTLSGRRSGTRYADQMTRHEATQRLRDWTDAEIGEHGFRADVEYITSQAKWPTTKNDQPYGDARRRAYFRIRLADDDMKDDAFREFADGHRGDRMRGAIEHLKRRAEEDPTLRGAVTEAEEVRTEFAEEGAIGVLYVTLTMDDVQAART